MVAALLSLGDFRAPIFNLSVARGDVRLEDEFELFMQLLGTYFGFVTLLVLALNWITREILDIGYDVFTSYDEPPSRVGQGRGIIWKSFGGIQGQRVAGDRRCKAIVGGRILPSVAENGESEKAADPKAGGLSVPSSDDVPAHAGFVGVGGDGFAGK